MSSAENARLAKQDTFLIILMNRYPRVNVEKANKNLNHAQTTANGVQDCILPYNNEMGLVNTTWTTKIVVPCRQILHSYENMLIEITVYVKQCERSDTKKRSSLSLATTGRHCKTTL